MKYYLIGGRARHGKDTLGLFIKEYYETQGKKACIMHISNYIKQFALNYFGWDGQDETKPRTLLQELGTGVIREKMNKPFFFINRLLEDMEVLENFFDVIIVTDVRLPMEFEKMKEHHPDAVTILIHRIHFDDGMTEEQRHHITEIALDGYTACDIEITNDTLEGLQADARQIVQEGEGNK